MSAVAVRDTAFSVYCRTYDYNGKSSYEILNLTFGPQIWLELQRYLRGCILFSTCLCVRDCPRADKRIDDCTYRGHGTAWARKDHLCQHLHDVPKHTVPSTVPSQIQSILLTTATGDT